MWFANSEQVLIWARIVPWMSLTAHSFPNPSHKKKNYYLFKMWEAEQEVETNQIVVLYIKCWELDSAG